MYNEARLTVRCDPRKRPKYASSVSLLGSGPQSRLMVFQSHDVRVFSLAVLRFLARLASSRLQKIVTASSRLQKIMKASSRLQKMMTQSNFRCGLGCFWESVVWTGRGCSGNGSLASPKSQGSFFRNQESTAVCSCRIRIHRTRISWSPFRLFAKCGSGSNLCLIAIRILVVINLDRSMQVFWTKNVRLRKHLY